MSEEEQARRQRKVQGDYADMLERLLERMPDGEETREKIEEYNKPSEDENDPKREGYWQGSHKRKNRRRTP